MTKFVLRLLDDADTLLAWAEVHAMPRPQARPAASCPFFASGPTLLTITKDGVATKTTIHWCDLDIARMNALLEPVEVKAGQVCSFGWTEPVWLVGGMRDVPLPAVTEGRSVTIGVPTAQLGMVGQV